MQISVLGRGCRFPGDYFLESIFFFIYISCSLMLHNSTILILNLISTGILLYIFNDIKSLKKNTVQEF